MHDTLQPGGDILLEHERHTSDVRRAVDLLGTDGIAGLPSGFSRAWTQQLREDIEVAFAAARARPDGTVGRGRNRYYVEVYPEQLRGFVDLVEHPWVRDVSAAVLGPDHQFVEVGFDVPLAGAIDQPWHRDFASPVETWRDGRLTSLAFNLTAVDTTEDMGPFEIAPGTQWEDGADFGHGMFPPRSSWKRFEQRAVRKLPRMGDVSVRSALTIHRGTANRSALARPVLVLGVVAPGAGDAEEHDLVVSEAYWAQLPERVRGHLRCRVVPELPPLRQRHTIEGLVMGDS